MKFIAFCLPLLSLLLLSPVAEVQGQDKEYVFKEIQEGVKFSSRWTHSRWKREESPLMLCLKVVNTNNYAVEVNFGIGYYFEGMEKETMEPVSICIPPGGTILGRRNYLCWLSEALSNAELQSSDFDWELIEVKVAQSDGCE